MASGVGDVFVDLIPNMEGFDDLLDEGLSQAAEGAGQTGGEVAGRAFNDTFSSAVGSGSDLTSGMEESVASAGDAAGQAGGETAAQSFESNFSSTVQGTLDSSLVDAVESAAGLAGEEGGNILAAAFGDAVSESVTDAIDTAMADMSDSLSSDSESAGEDAGTAAGQGMGQGLGNSFGLLGATPMVVQRFGTLGTVLGGVFAAYFGKQTLSAYETIESNTQRIQYGLTQMEMPALFQPLIDSAQAFSLESGKTEGDILKLQANLVSLGQTTLTALGPAGAQKAIEGLTEGLINMAAATGKPLALMTRSLGPLILNDPARALPMLQKFGALTLLQVQHINALIAAGKKEAATQEIINLTNERFAGGAKAALTPLADLKNRFNQLEIAVGKVLSVGTWLLDNVIKAIPGPMMVAVEAIGVAAGAMVLWNLVSGKMILLGGALLKALFGVIPGLSAVAAESISASFAVGGFSGGMETLRIYTLSSAAALKGWIAASWPLVTALAVVAAGAWLTKQGWDASNAAVAEAAAVYKQAEQQIAKTGEATDALVKIQNKYNKALQPSFFDQIREGFASIFGKPSPAQVWYDEYYKTLDMINSHTTDLVVIMGKQVGVADNATLALNAWIKAQTNAGQVADTTGLSLLFGEKSMGMLLGTMALMPGISDVTKQSLAGLVGQYVTLTGSTEGLNRAQILAAVSAGDYVAAELLVQNAARASGIEIRSLGNEFDTVAGIVGTTGEQLAIQFSNVMTTLAESDKKGKAALDLIMSTEQSIKSWAAGVGAAVATVEGEFDNLAKKSKNTTAIILHDNAKYIKDIQARARDTRTILRRSGTENEQQMYAYLQATGQMTSETLDQIAGMSGKSFDKMIADAKKWQTAQDRTAKAAAVGPTAVLLDIVERSAEAEGALENLNAIGIKIPYDSSGLVMANADVGKLAASLNVLTGLDFNVDITPVAGRALGGPVSAGTPYLVGERGPELFTPDQAGRIVPNSAVVESMGEQSGEAELTITNWDEGTGYIRYLARDESAERQTYSESQQRMHRRVRRRYHVT